MDQAIQTRFMQLSASFVRELHGDCAHWKTINSNMRTCEAEGSKRMKALMSNKVHKMIIGGIPVIFVRAWELTRNSR